MQETIERYVAINNPNEAVGFIQKYNMPAPANGDDLVLKMRQVLQSHGEPAFRDLAEINTPYKDLLAAVNNETPKVSNACGCSGADGSSSACGSYSNCNGDKACKCNCASNANGEEKPKETNNSEGKKDYMPMITVVALTGIFLVLATHKSK